MKSVRLNGMVLACAGVCAAAIALTSAFAGKNPTDSRAARPEQVASHTPRAPIFTVIYNFLGMPDTQLPSAMAIAQGRDGNLYTASPNGGVAGNGTVFSVTLAGVETVLNNIGTFPYGGVTLGTDGNFYGVDYDGGPAGNCGNFGNGGQVFKITPSSVLTILHNFTGSGDGCNPGAAPIQGTDGSYYGTTPSVHANSVAYKVTSDGVFTTLHTFTGTDGQDANGFLVQGTDGNFYGDTKMGGTSNNGVIYKMTPAGAVTVLHNFNGTTDGFDAFTGLVQATDGNFYGVACEGGTGLEGVVFKITPAGVYTVIHNFDLTTDGGAHPSASLMQATDGKLYGVLPDTGSGFNGTIYSITTSGTYATVWTFDGTTGGQSPNAPLKQNTNGVLYSDTTTGGTGACSTTGCGVFYSLDVGLQPFVSLVSTSGKEGVRVGILGQGFSASSVVKFGGVQATAVTAQGTTFLTATVPAGALTGTVTVTTGTTTLMSNRKFRVTPSITSFTPSSGPVGTPVTITGTGLAQTTKVTFHNVSATFTVNSDTQVTATVPTGATTGKISVATAGGTAISAASFTVN